MSKSDDEILGRFLEGLLVGEELTAFHARLVSDPALARASVRSAADAAIVRAWAAAPKPEVRGWWGRQTIFTALAGLAAALAIGIGTWHRPAGEGARVGSETVTDSKAVAYVDPDPGCEWAAGPVARDVRAGQDLELTAGVAEMVTARGVRLVAEAPAAFRFDSAAEIRLSAGRLYCEVPPAQGLTVATPDGRVVDLGTRFGVAATPGTGTETHVFEGKVEAEVGGSLAKSPIVAGTAARFRFGDATVRMIPLTATFLTRGSIVEPFDYPDLALNGQGGWFDVAGGRGEPVRLTSEPLAYPGWPAARGRVLEITPAGRPSRPVARRWPPGFTSAVLRLDDDFPKNMAINGFASAGLFRLGSSEGGGVWVVVRPSRRGEVPDSAMIQVGVRLNGQESWAPRSIAVGGTHLVVVETRPQEVRLWVDPVVGPLAPPSLTLATPASSGSTVVQIGDPGNPTYGYWFLDELRGGPAWSDVVPQPKRP